MQFDLDDIANHGGPRELSDYARDDLERFKLAAEVILRIASEGAIGDALEAELTIFRDRLEHALLGQG